MIGLAVIAGILMYYNSVLSGTISTGIYKNIIDDLYTKIQTLDMKYFSDSKVGDLMSRFSNDASMITNYFRFIYNNTIYDCNILFSSTLYYRLEINYGSLFNCSIITSCSKKVFA